MSTILETIKNFFFDKNRQYGDNLQEHKEEARIVITSTSTDSLKTSSPLMNSNYSSVNPHLFDSHNEKHSANIVAVMPNPAGNTCIASSQSSENSLQVKEETSLIRKFKKRRHLSSHGRTKR